MSVTTVPWRIRFLGAVLDSLLAQTSTEFEVHVYVPATSVRTGGAYDIPAKLAERVASEPRVQLRRIDTDYGPATKLLGPYEAAVVAGVQPTIVTVDDDILLEAHAVEELLEAHARHPKDALGFMGADHGSFVHAELLAASSAESVPVGVLGGYRAVLYPWSALDKSLFEDVRTVSEHGAFLDDDHLIGWNLGRRGVMKRVIATRHPGPNGSLNVGSLDLPGPITGGDHGNEQVDRSHRCLRDLYEERAWSIPP